MYSRGSAVACTRTSHSSISPATRLLLQVVKRAKLDLDFQQHSSLSRPDFETAQHIDTKVSGLVQRWWSYVQSNFGAFRSTPSEECILEVCLPLEKRATKFAKSSITQPRIFRFRSNLVSEFDHVTCDVLQTFKVKRSKVKVTFTARCNDGENLRNHQ